MNVMRSLVDKTPFLGKFKVQLVEGRIAVFNYELTKSSGSSGLTK